MKLKKPKYSARTLLRWPGIFLLLFAFFFISCLITVLPLSSRSRRAWRIRNTSIFSGVALSLFGVRVHAKPGDRLRASRPGRLIICNHISYVDVLVLAALRPAVFVTSVELKNTFLLGLLARFAGSVFVERRKPAGLKQEIRQIADILNQGLSVVLFPEGTTSNGERVHPFKRSLFDAALSSGALLLPLCLRYTKIDNEPIDLSNRENLFYYGGVSFTKHFPRFISLPSVNVEVIMLRSIRSDQYASRKELAALSHELVSKAYGSSST